MVLPECLYVAVDALYLFDRGVREFCIVVTGGVVMASGEVWLYTSILLLATVSVGEFSRLNFRQASFYCFFVRQYLAPSFLLLTAAYFSVVVNSDCSRLWGSLGGVLFVSTLYFGDYLMVFTASREILTRVMLLVDVLI